MMLQSVGAHIVLRNWWMLAIRGALAIIFGLVALLFPGIAILAFIYIFAAYAIIDGIVAVAVSLGERGTFGRWTWLLIEGVFGILAGFLAIAYPGLTALVLLYIIAIWAILTGILEIIAAFTFHEQVALEWALNLAGLFSILFGLLLLLHPGAGILTILWLVGIYAIVFGILFIVRALQLRSWASSVTTHVE